MDARTTVQLFWASYEKGDLDATWETYVDPAMTMHPSSGFEFTRET